MGTSKRFAHGSPTQPTFAQAFATQDLHETPISSKLKARMQDSPPNSLQPNELQSPTVPPESKNALPVPRSKRSYTPTQAQNVVLEIQETMAASMLKDARLWVTLKPPNPGSEKRLRWDKSRSLFVSTFRQLFGLDQQQSMAPGGAWTGRPAGPVIDVQVSPQTEMIETTKDPGC